LAALVAMLTAAACTAAGSALPGPAGSALPGPAGASATTPGPAPSASALAPSASALAPPAAPPPGRTAQRCHTGGLTGDVEARDSAPGQRYAALGLKNTTSTACTLYGYPGLQLVDANGAARPTTVVRDRSVAPRSVVVKPGQTAWALLRWTVIPADDEAADHCAPDPASLRVIPPDETTRLTTEFDYGAVCQHGRVVVDPFGVDPFRSTG
jgi:Protein of unknown function (DUF4232)